MTHLTRRLCLGSMLVAAALPAVWAQPAWPAKPISITVGLQAGTGSDIAMRNIAEKVSVA